MGNTGAEPAGVAAREMEASAASAASAAASAAAASARGSGRAKAPPLGRYAKEPLLVAAAPWLPARTAFGCGEETEAEAEEVVEGA